VLTGFAAGAERGDSSKVGSAVGDSSEEGSTGGDSSEMGLTDSAEGKESQGRDLVEDQPENQNYLQKIKVRNRTSCVPRIPHVERLENAWRLDHNIGTPFLQGHSQENNRAGSGVEV
jgi:hypothetical protein